MSTNETDISPDSGEETDDGGDIQAIGENLFKNRNWRILKLKNDIYRFFLVEFVNNKKTNRRKCIRCKTIVLSCNRGTSSMQSHLKFCRKFIGLFCYFRKETFCLGLVHDEGACGAERMLEYINCHLELFGISMVDVDMFTTDCGSDVCKVARLAQKFTFPCLCHVINLIVKSLF